MTPTSEHYSTTCLSTSRTDRFAGWLHQMYDKLLASAAYNKPRLYIDWGLCRSGGIHNTVVEYLATNRSKEMVHLLEHQYGFNVPNLLQWVEDPQGKHDEDSWRDRFIDIVQRYFGRNESS